MTSVHAVFVVAFTAGAFTVSLGSQQQAPCAPIGPLLGTPGSSGGSGSSGSTGFAMSPPHPPCSQLLKKGVDAPDPTPTQLAATRARQQPAALQSEIDTERAQLVALAQSLRTSAMAQNNNQVLSATALKQAHDLASLAKKLQDTLKSARP